MNILDTLLFNLQTIANVSKGKKISTAKEFITIDEDSIFNPLWRRIAGDERDKAVRAICREVRTVIFISELVMDNRHIYAESEKIVPQDDCDVAMPCAKTLSKRDIQIDTLKKIKFGLEDAQHGIENICGTYVNDANVLAKLIPLSNEIVLHVNKLKELLILLGEFIEVKSTWVRK
jgi:hypothetical protein